MIENMNTRKLAYSLAVIMLSYDVLSTLIASKLYGRFADLSPIHNSTIIINLHGSKNYMLYSRI